MDHYVSKINGNDYKKVLKINNTIWDDIKKFYKNGIEYKIKGRVEDNQDNGNGRFIKIASSTKDISYYSIDGENWIPMNGTGNTQYSEAIAYGVI